MVTTVTTINTVTTVPIVTTVTTVTSLTTVTTIIIKYQKLLLFSSKYNFFTKVLDRPTNNNLTSRAAPGS